MQSEADHIFFGESSKPYRFEVYDIDEEFEKEGAVYVVVKETFDAVNNIPARTPLYIGQTQNLSGYFKNHHKKDCYLPLGANKICIHQIPEEETRLKIETNLVNGYAPICNK